MSFLDRGPAPLFCPADRPDRVLKAFERADAVIVDLEDGVSPADRPAARDAVRALDVDPAGVVVRINPVETADFARDLAAISGTPFTTIMLAKTESAAQLDRVPDRYNVVALCETARGVVEAEHIARHDRAVAMMWGAEDLIASLGGSSSRFASGGYRDVARAARARVLLAAGAADIPAIDAVHLDVADITGLRAECEDGVASGFAATACIHPSQVEVVRAAFTPEPEALAWAHAVTAAARGAAGVFLFEGRMVDEPILRHARTLVRRAERAAPRG